MLFQNFPGIPFVLKIFLYFWAIIICYYLIESIKKLFFIIKNFYILHYTPIQFLITIQSFFLSIYRII